VARTLLPASAPRPGHALSERETQVLRLLTQGLTNRQIARTLAISENTVKVHATNLFRRIGVSDRTSAAMWARDHLPALVSS
jgi:DNA-binding NarL/FixJ family response regulator